MSDQRGVPFKLSGASMTRVHVRMAIAAGIVVGTQPGDSIPFILAFDLCRHLVDGVEGLRSAMRKGLLTFAPASTRTACGWSRACSASKATTCRCWWAASEILLEPDLLTRTEWQELLDVADRINAVHIAAPADIGGVL